MRLTEECGLPSSLALDILLHTNSTDMTALRTDACLLTLGLNVAYVLVA